MTFGTASRSLHSSDQAPDGPIPLRAGPLTMLFEQGGVRYIRYGEIEVIRRIYAAVRDHNWNTIAGTLRNVRIDQGRDFFHIEYESEHAEGGVAFVWRGEINGEPDGTIRFTFDGEARSTFLKNRIGFCVLHPIRECTGKKCWAEYADGKTHEAKFPGWVAPEQPVKRIHDLAAIAHEVAAGLRAAVRFHGDRFEMEDQRNWIDASFKTYCTPLRLPYPAEIKAGTRVQQTVTVTLAGKIETPRVSVEDAAVQIGLNLNRSFPIPPIGLGISSYLKPYSTEQANKLKELNLAHLRVELDLSGDWMPVWGHAVAESAEIAVPLEVALIVPEGGNRTIGGALKKAAGAIARIAAFTKGAKSTSAETLAWARKAVGDLAPIGVGTNADFYQLNQARPPWEDADFVCWSMNPQVHAFDDTSIMETPEAVLAQVASARHYFPDKPLVVSPITLKPRFNPVATGPDGKKRAGTLPPEVEARQRTDFAAAWTFSMLKWLIQSGADSITCFETVGWRGVIEGEHGAPMPELFQSKPEEVFPVWEVFRSIAEFTGGEVIESRSSNWRKVESLALRKGDRQKVIAQNMSPIVQRFEHSVFGGLLARYERAAWEPKR